MIVFYIYIYKKKKKKGRDILQKENQIKTNCLP